MKNLTWTALLLMALLLVTFVSGAAQQTPPESLTEEQQKQKEENERRAFAMIEQIANESQFLRLPENRIRMQFSLADLLWTQNPERARSMFSLAADGVAELLRNADPSEQQRRGPNTARSGVQLRQELVLTAARHDAALAYQLLSATKPPAPVVNPNDPVSTRRFDVEEMLEQNLLSQVAAMDPKFALQQAEQMLDKGELKRSLADVLRQLQTKDKEAAAKLEDRIVKKLQAANILSSNDVAALALSLLQPGPRISDTQPATAGSPAQPLISASAYQDLLSTVIEAALKTTAQAATGQRRVTAGRGRAQRGANTNAQPQPRLTEAQTEQSNARRMLGGLRALLPQVDQYVPGKASSVRQKLTEMGMTETPRGQMAQFATLFQPGTSSESLLSAASTAPANVQPRIYRQAAMKALDEGNPDRAKQIANEHLDPRARDAMLRTLEFSQLANKSEGARMDEIRQALGSLASDGERLNALLQMSETMRNKDPEFALKLVDQAREYTNRRAANYQQFDQQLRVSSAYSALGSAQAFEVLEPGIMHLNELLAAAAVLSGFETNVFRDGEMPLQGGGGLADVVRRYAQQIGRLAKTDQERAEGLINRFQNPEPRVIARLSVVQALLGNEPRSRNNFRFLGPFDISN